MNRKCGLLIAIACMVEYCVGIPFMVMVVSLKYWMLRVDMVS